MPSPDASSVDVVVVSYNSRDRLVACVELLLAVEWVNVVVVDNASPDGSLGVVRDLPITAIQLERNGGFAHGVNAGWRQGSAPYVLLLNPDARIDQESLRILVKALEAAPDAGAAAPRIVDGEGRLDYSQRRFPRLRSTYAQALFLHRLFPEAPWADELVRDPTSYERPTRPEWVSGACVLMRRSVLEELGGLDEEFFMYAEDIDLCRRMRALGYDILFEPRAYAGHDGGASAPRAGLLPVLAASRRRYATKHFSPPGALLERVGIALGSLTHMLVGQGGLDVRLGHAAALWQALAPALRTPPGPSDHVQRRTSRAADHH